MKLENGIAFLLILWFFRLIIPLVLQTYTQNNAAVEVVALLNALSLRMYYRVVLIFADTQSIAAFVEYLQLAGEVYGNEYMFVGTLTEDQIKIARQKFGAYVRVARQSE